MREAKLAHLKAEVRRRLDRGKGQPRDAEALKRQAKPRRTAKSSRPSRPCVMRRPLAEEDVFAIWDFIADEDVTGTSDLPEAPQGGGFRSGRHLEDVLNDQQARHCDCEASICGADARTQMKKRADRIASVWDALADPPEQAANLRMRAALSAISPGSLRAFCAKPQQRSLCRFRHSEAPRAHRERKEEEAKGSGSRP